MDKELPKIAVFSGPTATIQNSPPLISGESVLRAQRVAVSAEIWVEQFSGHPLEADSADLYAPPDGWIDEHGSIHAGDSIDVDPTWTPAIRIRIEPKDGPLLLPYTAKTRDGKFWESNGLTPDSEESAQRQTFYPDATRLYEEIDRFGVDFEGHGRPLSSRARFEFFRPAPSGGYRNIRSQDGDGQFGGEAFLSERRGIDYFGYFPRHLRTEPGTDALVRATNLVNRVLSSGQYIGGQWLEGSPTAEESLYWFNLVLDASVPLVGHSAQRPHGTLSADGDRNIVDGVRYLTSGVWKDESGADQFGVVMIVDEVIFSSREVAKTDARPGNYVAAGGFGGIVGAIEGGGSPVMTFSPTRRHTFRSELRISSLPTSVRGMKNGSEIEATTKDVNGLVAENFPVVTMIKYGRYSESCCGYNLVEGWLNHVAKVHPLAGIVAEGSNPYGTMDPATDEKLKLAAYMGYPVVRCGRGNTAGFTPRGESWSISGNNLTASKARILLIAALLRFGTLPPAADPLNPSDAEASATAEIVAKYQEIFDTH